MLSVGQDWAVEHARWRVTGAAAVARQRRAAEAEGVGRGVCAEGGVGSAAGAARGGVGWRGWDGLGRAGEGAPWRRERPGLSCAAPKVLGSPGQPAYSVAIPWEGLERSLSENHNQPVTERGFTVNIYS